MKNVIIVRERGQLTIPDAIRKMVSWVGPMSAVTISVVKPDEIVIRPHQKQMEWDKIWKAVKKARSIKGKNAISALEVLQKDRNSH